MTLQMTSTQVVETSVTTNKVPLRTTQTRPNDSKDGFHTGFRNVSHNQQSPSQDYTNPPSDCEDSFHTGCRNVSHNQQQSFSGLPKPDPMTLQMTSTQVVETSVTTNKVPLRTTQTRPNDCKDDFHTRCRNFSHNQQSLSQDYTNSDDQPITNMFTVPSSFLLVM